MELIKRLQGDRRFMGTCTECGSDFHLADAVLFPISDALPDEARAWIKGKRKAFRERRTSLDLWRTQLTEGVERTTKSVNIGKTVEQIAPSLASFPFRPGDCRALFAPIDYLVFDGLQQTGAVTSLVFAELKSGMARATKSQTSTREAVNAGKVKLVVLDDKKE